MTDRRKRPSRFSQSGKLLALLETGGWWSTRDLLREVPSVVHSRIAELRRSYGCTIEHRTNGAGAAGSLYRLVSGPLGREGEPRRASVARGSGEPSVPSGAGGPPPEPSPFPPNGLTPSGEALAEDGRVGAPQGSPAAVPESDRMVQAVSVSPDGVPTVRCPAGSPRSDLSAGQLPLFTERAA